MKRFSKFPGRTPNIPTKATCRHRTGSTGCKEPATHYPSVLVWCAGKQYEHPPISSVHNVPMCRSHALEPGWLPKHGQQSITRMMAAQLPLVRRLGLDWTHVVYRAISIVDGHHQHTREPTNGGFH